MKRRVFNKAAYVIRIGGTFSIAPNRGVIVPEEFAKDPAIDRYIKIGILEGALLEEAKPATEPAPKKVEAPVEKPTETKPEEKPTEETPAEEKPKTTRKKRGSKAKTETAE